jgi:hypothetical protein
MNDEGGGASRSTEPASGTSAATDVSLREHLAQQLHDAQRRIDERDRYLREADQRFGEERDRRYTEVAIEREKALRIKETADLAALGLAREIQTYKDEKANELREQISSERGLYASKEDVKSLDDKLEIRLAPLIAYVASQQGRHEGVDNFTKTLIALVSLALVIAGLVLGLR